MKTHHDIIRELDEYAKAANTEPSSVCRKATGNPRLYDRLIRRFERIEADISTLRSFMADNPPSVERSEVSCPPKNVGTNSPHVKGAA